MSVGFSLFDTAIGPCGIAWSETGVVAVQLPEARERETLTRLLERCRTAREVPPPADVQRAIDGIVALLTGKPTDLSAVTLDMEGVPAFHRRVYDVARTIPCGSTLTYGEIASALGAPGSARAVGQALGHNPFAVIVPCHRVLASGGKTGGFSAAGGVAMKLRILAIEGAQARGALTLFEK